MRLIVVATVVDVPRLTDLTCFRFGTTCTAMHVAYSDL